MMRVSISCHQHNGATTRQPQFMGTMADETHSKAAKDRGRSVVRMENASLRRGMSIARLVEEGGEARRMGEGKRGA
jgi:hypothetical protein